MRTTIFFLLSFILCVFTASSAPAPDPVTTVTGKPVRTGVQYYMWGNWIGNLFPLPVRNSSCPAGVVTNPSLGYTVPVIITPVNPKKGVIRLSTDVNIKFKGSNVCHTSNVWKVEYDKTIKQYAVMVGGVEGNPGPDTLNNWFKIEKIEEGYKLVYCPSVCSYCKVMCKDVGKTIDSNGVMRLVLGGRPLSFNLFNTGL